jgi:toxin ParE1/3/4
LKAYSFHPEAQLEADGASAYYSQLENPAAQGFLDGLTGIVLEIRSAPQRWPFESGTKIQRRVFRRFPHILFYENNLHEIYILALAHTSRRPGHWKSRIAVD